MQQVLSRTTSACSTSLVASMPSCSKSPANRSESCAFIWHPKVRIRYVRDTGPRLGEGLRAQSRLSGPRGRGATLAIVHREPDGRAPLAVDLDVGEGQIGRASCRERGERAAGAVSVTRKGER